MDGSFHSDQPPLDTTESMTGLAALARLPLLQAATDRRAGLRTGGFVSGYRGSPLGGYDMALAAIARDLAEANITFQPGLNEDLAATAVWGSQQVGLLEPASVDGVFGIWYGKGPGVDRSGDALKHANLAGVSRLGGVVALAGDDHLAKSSTVAFQSEPALIAAGIPVLYPADVSELMDYGLQAIAMSRYSGTWAAMKCLVDVVESSTALLSEAQLPGVYPDLNPLHEDVHIRWPDDPLGAERRLWETKIPAARHFAAVRGIDRVTHGGTRPTRLGIIASGRTWLQVVEVLRLFGLTSRHLAEAGVSVLKVGLLWPLSATPVQWARGAETILVVEDKQSLIEGQLKEALFSLPAEERPRILGKCDASGKPVFPAYGQIDFIGLASVLREHLQAVLPQLHALPPQVVRAAVVGDNKRPAWFCAGCPHSTSTRVPDGSRAGGGIGCHTMALWMDRNTALLTHMGAEGANWIGQAPFSSVSHVFQNLGDGTYNHSGSLAIRAAVAAGVNITYKLLYNDAVAMTGGQYVDGTPTPWKVARQIMAEGVAELVVISDEIGRYGDAADWPHGLRVLGRGSLDAEQRRLREISGVTVILYDQTCAAEKRRRRRKDDYPKAGHRIIINELVCEGCGDCGVQSNCVAVTPVETEFGQKRRIKQSECNQDRSCIDGFCPSFVTMPDRGLSRPVATLPLFDPDDMPDEPLPNTCVLPYRIVIAGIGGTGVVTCASLIGRAARVAGLHFVGLDQTGLAQKNGAVTSHVCIAASGSEAFSPRTPPQAAGLILAADVATACDHDAAAYAIGPTTRIVADMDQQPFATDLAKPNARPVPKTAARHLAGRVDSADFLATSAAAVAASIGEAGLANVYLLGAALQRGWLPLRAAHLEQAIRDNGIAVERNLLAFRLGRRDAAREVTDRPLAANSRESEQEMIDRRAAFLRIYQSQAYAERYLKGVAAARQATDSADPLGLVNAVARNLFKVMAYKDEYEVARLHTDPVFESAIREQGGSVADLSYHFAPPFLSGLSGNLQRPTKYRFGPWVRPFLQLLRHGKVLRGSWLDPFGYTADRRVERLLRDRYESSVLRAIHALQPATLATTVELARLPERIRGFGPVKAASLAAVEADWADLEATIAAAGTTVQQ